MATPVIRRFLDNLRETASMLATGPMIVVTTPNGQIHEMGVMTAAVAGCRVIYMMPSLPARDIAAAATKNPAGKPGL